MVEYKEKIYGVIRKLNEKCFTIFNYILFVILNPTSDAHLMQTDAITSETGQTVFV